MSVVACHLHGPSLSAREHAPPLPLPPLIVVALPAAIAASVVVVVALFIESQ